MQYRIQGLAGGSRVRNWSPLATHFRSLVSRRKGLKVTEASR